MNRPGKQVWIDHFEPLQVWRFPFRLENFLLAAVLIFLWSFLLGSYYVGGLILVARSALAIYSTAGFFFCYLFLILDFTTRGYQKPPKISGNLLNANKVRFIKGLLVTSMLASLFYAVRNSPIAAVSVGIASLIFWPVAVSIIAIQDKFLNALNPIHWLNFYRSIQLDKFFYQYCITLSLVVLFASSLQTHYGWLNIVTMSGFVISFIWLFRALGVLIHANAHALGISVRFGPQVEAEQIERSQSQALSDFGLSLYQLTEVNRTKEAFAEYQKHLAENSNADEDDLWSLISAWSKPDLAILAGQGYIERLVARRQIQQAWTVLEFCFNQNSGEYLLTNGDTLLRLASAANNSTQRKIAAQMLRYFDKDFPRHPQASEALLNAVQLLLTDLNDTESARKLLAHIRIKFPEATKTRQYQKLEEAF